MKKVKVFFKKKKSFDITYKGNLFTAKENETILQAATKCNIDIPNYCRKGICGKCKSTIIKGRFLGQNGINQSKAQMASLCTIKPLSNMVII